MAGLKIAGGADLARLLGRYSRPDEVTGRRRRTRVEQQDINGVIVPVFINAFWTARQRQGASIHEVSYRACFKPQLPAFFIRHLSAPGEVVYDPFGGRGTTAVEAALLDRQAVSNDVNPLSRILTEPRLAVPLLTDIAARLEALPQTPARQPELNLSMFYHSQTEREIAALREYLHARRANGEEDAVDRWIRMVATNRLTGHSPGFFSVYTLPPNQAVSPERQIKINQRLGQEPAYRDTRRLILNKSTQLIKGLTDTQLRSLRRAALSARFLNGDARTTPDIAAGTVRLTVTSPPFLDIVQYAQDNWLRCWFNNIDGEAIAQRITMARTVAAWSEVMLAVFQELYRITCTGGWVAFEVGEVRRGSVRLDEMVVPLGCQAGFACAGIVINSQVFTKTSNIWGIRNNASGTNSNRIVLFQKE